MIELKVYEKQNLLLVKILEEISNSNISTGVVKVGQLLSQLSENYTLITDISQFKQTTPEQSALFNKIVKSMDDKLKIGSIIRVVGNSKQNIEHFCKMDKLFNLKNVKYVASLEDAMNLFNGNGNPIEKDC